MYNRATTGPLKDSLLLHFAYADFEEVSVHVQLCYLLIYMIFFNRCSYAFRSYMYSLYIYMLML